MSHSASNEQVSIQDPHNPVLQELLTHPDYRAVAAFSLGWVFISSAYCAFTSSLLRDLVVRGLSWFVLRKRSDPVKDIEAPASPREWNVKSASETVPTDHAEADANASIFVLNLCFFLAALANFSSLLDLGGQKGSSTACTVVVAWSSMASQSVRIVGLLMLSWRLRHLGMKRLETYMLWLGLLVVLGLVFAVNGTAPGAVSVVGSSGISVCYRQYFLPVALTLSGVVMLLEAYVAARAFTLGTPRSATLKGFLRRLLNIEVARPISLLILDLATVVQSAIWVNSLAQFIPFSLAALLVIAVFNSSNALNTTPDDPEPALPYRVGSFASADRLSMRRPNSFLEPSPFLLHFMEQPLSPDSHVNAVPVGSQQVWGRIREQDGDFVLQLGASHDDDSEEPAPPRSAPANLTETPIVVGAGPRQILPFQVQYVEQLERQMAATPSGPVPPRRERPKVYVVTDKNDHVSPTSRRSRASIIGSDIIRLAPSTPHRKREGSLLWSPESSTPSAFPYSPRRGSSSTTHKRVSAFSVSTQMKRSPTVQSEYAEQDSFMSPQDPGRRFSWRLLSRHQSGVTSRTVSREELSTVAEGSSSEGASSPPSRSTSRIQTKRLTFGQPVKPALRKQENAASSTACVAMSLTPALPRSMSTRSSQKTDPSLTSSDVPPVPPIPSPLLSPNDRGGGLLDSMNASGTENVQGPRPPPIALPFPASPRAAPDTIGGESVQEIAQD